MKVPYWKLWQKTNPDKVKAAQVKYRSKHKKKRAAYYQKTKKHQQELTKQRYLKNTEATKERYRGYYYKDKEKRLRYNRLHKLHIRYGITVEDYDRMFLSQNGRCAICERVSTRRLDVDHSHLTGKVRQLLCNKCNLCLGLTNDSINYLFKLVDYLIKNGD